MNRKPIRTTKPMIKIGMRFFHFMCSLFGLLPRQKNGFQRSALDLKQKSDHHCRGSLIPKEMTRVVASKVRQGVFGDRMAKVVKLLGMISPRYSVE